MWWSTNTVSSDHSRSFACVVFAGMLLSVAASAQDITLHVPSDAVAGKSASIATAGTGSATFYLVGPSFAAKRNIRLGSDIALHPSELQASGRYIAVLCASACSSAEFFVAPAQPVSLTFLVHPSRAPVAQNGAISGVAIPFDRFQNMILQRGKVDFQLAAKGGTPSTHTAETHEGIAWFRTNSGKSAGPLQVEASLGPASARRVVQQVASDPCNLRIRGQRTAKGISVETDPVRDCAGNPIPDGTIVTFTAKADGEVSTVDAPVKQDVARAQIQAKGPAVISAASGVVMGNELRVDGQ